MFGPAQHVSRARRGAISAPLGVAAVGLVVLLLLLPGASDVVRTHPALGPAPPSVGAGSLPATGSAPAERPAGPSVSPSFRIIHPILPQWVNVTSTVPGGAPPSSYGGTMAYDPMDNETVYFGGCTNTQCPSDQTWVFTRGLWTNITNPSDAPPARQLASMDFDGNVHSVLLFGGAGANGPLGDTWLFQGGIWTNVTFLSQGPAPREGGALAFDPAPEENGSVLYGGCVPFGLGQDCVNNTWVWQSWSGWVPLTTSITPPGVGFGAMAYDPSSGDIVLFGGCAGVFCSSLSGSTWELYSGQWWAVYPSSSPIPRTEVSMVYDPAIPGLLLFGGLSGSFPDFADQNDTWSFSNGAWTLWSPPSAPSQREDYTLSTDPTGGTPLLFGGSSDTGSQNDTWAYEYVLGAYLTASTYTSEVGESVTFTVTVGGGSGPFNATIAFGDGSLGLLDGAGPDAARRAHLPDGGPTWPA